MFVLADYWEYETPVQVRLPDGSSQEFRARFRVTPELVERLRDPEEAVGALREAWVDWADIADANGEPVPWASDIRDRLLELPFVCGAVTHALANSLAAARGNA